MLEKRNYHIIVSMMVTALFLGVAPILIVNAQKPPESSLKDDVVDEFAVQPVYFKDNGSDICRTPENIPDEELHWTYIPDSPSELNTQVQYYYLAGQLIVKGLVDASDCPNGGVDDFELPNACGLSRAESLVFQLQNQFDDEILAAWEEVGTPPVLLKQLIRQESQFWPGRWGIYHWGLGHVTYSGAHTGLLWNFKLYREVCLYTYDGQCTGINEMMVYSLLSLFDAECPECENRLDIEKAERSIHYLAETVMGHCNQTAQIIYNVTGRPADELVDYTTIWKLTLYDYNAGAMCVYNSIHSAWSGVPVEDRSTVTFDWDILENYASTSHCQRGIDYADLITGKFYDFPPDQDDESSGN